MSFTLFSPNMAHLPGKGRASEKALALFGDNRQSVRNDHHTSGGRMLVEPRQSAHAARLMPELLQLRVFALACFGKDRSLQNHGD
jgi:hypothetical protein